MFYPMILDDWKSLNIIFKDNNILLIKFYRALTGKSLIESKKFIEAVREDSAEIEENWLAYGKITEALKETFNTTKNEEIVRKCVNKFFVILSAKEKEEKIEEILAVNTIVTSTNNFGHTILRINGKEYSMSLSASGQVELSIPQGTKVSYITGFNNKIIFE